MMNRKYKLALIEFGKNEKTGYAIIKGENTTYLNPMDAHTYWYPKEITNEEAIQEVNDLIPYYETVVIFTPLLEHISSDILVHINDRPKNEVLA